MNTHRAMGSPRSICIISFEIKEVGASRRGASRRGRGHGCLSGGIQKSRILGVLEVYLGRLTFGGGWGIIGVIELGRI